MVPNEGASRFAWLTPPMQGQTDPQRIRALHPLKVGKEMAPGNYVLQIIVTDLSDKKPRVASRWIDFEVVN